MVAGSGLLDDIGEILYVDPPVDEAVYEEAVPETGPELHPDRWRFRFPWVKTAVSAPTYIGELLIANRTDRTWVIWHNYHNLGLLDPGDERSVRLVRAGTLSARPLVANASSEYLLLTLSQDHAGAEIVTLVPDDGVFVLRPMEQGSSTLEGVPESTSIEELGLSARTVNALKRIDVTTAGELRKADLGALWDVRNGPAAYVDLLEMSWRRGRKPKR